jgi:hypothetical protein
MPVLWGSRSDFNLICEHLRLARDALSGIAFFAFGVFVVAFCFSAHRQ